ncbi:hypothetical protein GV827_18360 [Sulfitobacter sp. JBTF-M27]|uniref:Phytanoyl-CoA dioxygenase n=1 Tax=Sulfitobacter sediminilitoris TaxID=2698830 RepID=A0A6P0CDT7_9RHOB|nr:hypothetical protein [Sulfitobacter sediminilitoris]NEK24352.1 hypothetical protein [Sulfitobacter sediminilitoris]
MVEDGFVVFDSDPDVKRWAAAAHRIACKVSADPAIRAANLRHGETWFVGVDCLPNNASGAICDVALKGPWEAKVPAPSKWHAAQLSIVYPGYPAQDPEESDANHRYRIKRHAAHVDGLLPLGPKRRRYLREPHAFILGLPLNEANAAPLMVWPGSHRIMGKAFRRLVGDRNPLDVDLTDIYQDARREVFEHSAPQAIIAKPGASILLHRHLLHGVAPWAQGQVAPPEGRMIAYFRPQFSAADWLADT